MSDIKLFRLKDLSAAEILGSAEVLEKSLQNLIERNLEPLLGIQLLASEHSTGRKHKGRIDSLEFSRPGKPTDNAFIESFNGSLRDECLNVHWFDDLTDAKEKLQAWRREYNESRPHRSLDELSPLEFKARWAENKSEIR